MEVAEVHEAAQHSAAYLAARVHSQSDLGLEISKSMLPQLSGVNQFLAAFAADATLTRLRKELFDKDRQLR